MPAARSRALLASELETAAAHAPGIGGERLDEQIDGRAGADADDRIVVQPAAGRRARRAASFASASAPWRPPETTVPAVERAQSSNSTRRPLARPPSLRPISSSKLSSWPSSLPSPCWLSNVRVSPGSEYIHANRNYKRARSMCAMRARSRRRARAPRDARCASLERENELPVRRFDRHHRESIARTQQHHALELPAGVRAQLLERDDARQSGA